MADTITDTWNNPEGAELRAKLFPDGQPTPEEFIKVVTAHMKNIQTSKQEAP